MELTQLNNIWKQIYPGLTLNTEVWFSHILTAGPPLYIFPEYIYTCNRHIWLGVLESQLIKWSYVWGVLILGGRDCKPTDQPTTPRRVVNPRQETSWASFCSLEVIHRRITYSSWFPNTHTHMANHSPTEVNIYNHVYQNQSRFILFKNTLLHPRYKLTWNVLPQPDGWRNVEHP